jgi:tetratricopeptide (TPR) repeat protein
MATDPAPPAPHRRLWQLPTFLVGLAALIGLWNYGPRLRPSVSDRFDRAIQALRPAVDHWPPDVDQVQAALRKLPVGDPPPDKAAQVHYLIGSAHVALAEATPTSPEAVEQWAQALRELESVPAKDLPVNDQKKLKYRLARTWYHTPGTDPKRTIAALAESVHGGDEPSEGFQILARLYHDGPTRDEAKERDSLRNYLKHASPRADARTLNEARVRLAALHAKLGEGEEARRVLERVGPEAPPEVYAAARLQIAGYHQAGQDWAAAATVWEQVRDMKGATDEQRAESRVHLAEAYVKLGRTDDAQAAVNDGKVDGPDGPAILFQRAKLRLRDPAAAKDAAIRDLEAAFAGADASAICKLVPAPEAQKVCEEAYEKAKIAGDFALAVRAATVFAKVADGGAEHRLLAEAHTGWAAVANGDEAAVHYKAAAAECDAAGKIDPTPTGTGDWLRKAAGLYLKAGDRTKGLAVLGDLTTRLVDYPEDKAGQAWAEMGDAYLAAGDREKARLAFQNAAGRTGPAQDRARVRFAALAQATDPGKGTAAMLLEEMVARPAEGRDPAALEEAVYLLAEIYLLRQDWPKAGDKLRAALTNHPDSTRAPRGHYQLGQVLRHTAYEAAGHMKADRAALDGIKKERLATHQPSYKVDEQLKIEDRLERAEKTFQTQMRAAFDEFRKAEDLFPTTPDADADTVRRTAFWAADCAFWLGQFAEGATRCEKLRARYQGHVDELEAGRDLYRCCVFAAEAARDAKDPDGAAGWAKRAIDTRTKIQQSLALVPAAEFDSAVETHKRTYWDGWLAETGKR